MTTLLLDLHKVHLYGWEKYKFLDRIEFFIQALHLGETFSPLFVRTIRGQEYHLDRVPRDSNNRELADGGHHRAIAHYLSYRPLPVIITGETPFIPSYSYLIGELRIVDTEGGSLPASFLRERYRQ